MFQERRRTRPILLLFTAWCAFCPRLSGQSPQGSTPTKTLAPSVRRVIFDKAAFSGIGTPLPQWENGRLISLDIETFQEGVANVRLYDASGTKTMSASIWFPDAVRVLIYSATVTPDGRIVAGGAAEKIDGTAAPFIVMTDLSGKLTDVIQTEGFGPTNICLAPDGTVWSFGGTGYDEQKRTEPKPGNTLRHFDFQKGEVASYLPRSLFPNRPRPESMARIHCAADGVDVYSPRTNLFIRIDYAGKAPEIYHTKGEPTGLQFDGFASTDRKYIYGHFLKLGTGGLYSLAFEEASKSATWVPVTNTVGSLSTPGVISALWGADGDKLLVSRAEDPAGMTALHWAPVGP